MDESLTDRIRSLEKSLVTAAGAAERRHLVALAILYARRAGRLGERDLETRALAVAAACPPREAERDLPLMVWGARPEEVAHR